MPKSIKAKKFTRQEIKKRLSYRPVYKVIDGMVVRNDARTIAVATAYRQSGKRGYLPSGKSSPNLNTATMAQDFLSSVGISVKVDKKPNFSLIEQESTTLKNSNIVVHSKDKSKPMNFQEMFEMAPSPTDPMYVMDDSAPNYLKKQNKKNSDINDTIDVADLVVAISISNRSTSNKNQILKQSRR